MLAVCTPDKVSLLDGTSGVLQRQLKCAPLHSSPQAMTYVPSKNMLAVSQERNCIFLFDPSSQRPIQKCFMPEPVVCLTASPCGTFLVGGGASGVAYLWLLASGELMQLAKGHLRRVHHIAINSAATQYATASDDGTVRVWGTYSCESEVVRSICTFTGHTLAVHSCEFFRWTNWVATASKDRTVRIFDAANGSVIFSAALRTPLTSILISQDDCFLTVGGTEGMLYTVALYPPGSESATLGIPATTATLAAEGAAGSTTSNLAVTTQDRVISMPSFSHGHEKDIVYLTHTSTSGHLVSMSSDGVCLLWENTAAPGKGVAGSGGEAAANAASGSFQPVPRWQVIHELWRAPPLAGGPSRFGSVCMLTLQGQVTSMESLKETPSTGPLLSKFPSLPGEDGIPVYTVVKPAHAHSCCTAVASASSTTSAKQQPTSSDAKEAEAATPLTLRQVLSKRQKRTRSVPLEPMSVLARQEAKKEKLLALANGLYRKLNPVHSIQVKTLTGKLHTLEEVESTETVKDLKVRIEALEGLPWAKQNLLLNGKPLAQGDGDDADQKTVEECKIPLTGATLSLMLKL